MEQSGILERYFRSYRSLLINSSSFPLSFSAHLLTAEIRVFLIAEDLVAN